jgi:hypothetical protein
LAGSAFGAGTFATFNATTTNAGSAFATGSLVLTNTKGAGSACYSNGTAANNTPGASTDTNANTNCDALFTAGTNKPGDSVSQALTINNVGSIAANGGLKLYAGTTAESDCVDGQRAGETYFGTGSMCETLTMTVHDDTSNLCIFGGGAAQEVKANTAALATPSSTVTITTSSNDQLVVNGTTITLDAGTFGFSMGAVANTTITNPTLETKLQKALITANVAALAGIGPDGIVYIAAKTPGASLTVAAPASRNAGAVLGFGTSGSPTQTAVFGATQAATCTHTPAHSVMNFTKMFTPLSSPTSQAPVTALAALPISTAKTFTVGLNIDTNAGNLYQGRLATFGMTWSALQ